jgi:hypothetical protein
MTNRERPRPGFARRWLLALLLALTLAVGCASDLPPAQLGVFEPYAPQIMEFSRNSLVCTPTSIGNALGGIVGYPLALVTLPGAWLAGRFSEDDELAFKIYGAPFWASVLLLGGATGGLFLPPALYLDEDPCDFGASTGWPGRVPEEEEESYEDEPE